MPKPGLNQRPIQRSVVPKWCWLSSQRVRKNGTQVNMAMKKKAMTIALRSFRLNVETKVPTESESTIVESNPVHGAPTRRNPQFPFHDR